MPEPTDLNTTLTRVTRILERAKPATPEQPPVPEKKTPTKLVTFLAFTLIGTMLPAQLLVIFFSLLALGTGLLYGILGCLGHIQIKRKAILSLASLSLVSVLSGCSPALFGKSSPELTQLIHDREYISHSIQKFGLFGLGTNDIDIKRAQEEANIETIYVAKIDTGYGLISLTRITVAGK